METMSRTAIHSMTILAAAALASAPLFAQGGLEALGAYAGVWQSKGVSHDTAYSKAGNNSAETRCNWSPNHGFLVCDQTVHPPDGGTQNDLSIYTYNDSDGTYQFTGLSRGSSRVRNLKLTIEGRRWTYSSQFDAGGKTVHFRTVNEFVSPSKVTFRAEYSEDGKTWTLMSEGASERAQ